MVDIEDLLCDILPDSNRAIFAVINQAQPSTNKPQSTQLSALGKKLQLRIMTPDLAHENSDMDSIHPISQPLNLSTTLSQLRVAVCQHLDVPIGYEALSELDCNCKLLCAIGGLEDRNEQDGGSARYLKLPVLAVCSRQSHSRQIRANGSYCDAAFDNRGLTVDLHTSECPIEITAHNKDVTLVTVVLHDSVIDGVLSIFAGPRVYSAAVDQGPATLSVRRAAIFQKQPAWEHPLGQTDRGFASLLSTLRTFTDITSGRDMDEDQQEAVLRILHLMTRFPPAVRTAYVLMREETPPPSESAALSQCLYEIMKEVIPLTIIRNDPLRFFEGSCLLEDADASVNRTKQLAASKHASTTTEHHGGERLALDELKEYLLGHASFDDMLAIVRSGTGDNDRKQNAGKVLDILSRLDQRRITAKT
ncbi:uncharacterized protein M421DRAFT_1134 [Didymella exigua CBS 183.55]|uniref:Uncharacterized protein n=1 Tax=Didymella exigua CBS 183.55 TaxID=1150837 RepID=A0A6A5S1J4_9PLEO|nr:uncharacterized protein M421DRAFT_1134 [Didymella exigua CBS 183.55]KAF1933763.1 hypothetical protein M421DRAFT_1134 [Didymella exigua CBS 183.55]